MASSYMSSHNRTQSMGSQLSVASRRTNASTIDSSLLEAKGVHVETFKDRMLQVKEWIFHKDIELMVMGRTVKDWGKFLMAIFLYIAGLILISSAFCYVFYRTVNWNRPMLQGPASILQTPGMSFRPQPRPESTLVRFYRGCPFTTCTTYIDHLEAYIQYYEKELQVGERFADCKTINGRREHIDEVCAFELETVSDICNKQISYGYGDGEPCFFLKLNKVFDWMPEEYKHIDEVPDAIKDIWDPDDRLWIYVACEGRDKVSNEIMGDVSIWPAKGFQFKYFPFRNQQSYRSPLVAVQFTDAPLGVLLMIRCRAYARNIQHVANQMVGETHFEIIVD